jgi:hypothetical protein
MHYLVGGEDLASNGTWEEAGREKREGGREGREEEEREKREGWREETRRRDALASTGTLCHE